VSRALADPELRRPENVDPALAGLEGISWKTGTSSGYKDAWTIAYDRTHTVGVWIGNFDGHGSKALVGARAAAPVALQLIERLRPARDAHAPWPIPPPAELKNVVVCAESGMPAGEDCPTTCIAEAPIQKVAESRFAELESAPICQVHQRSRVDVRTGEQLCMRCLAGHDCRDQVFAYWPGPVAAWLATNPTDHILPPPHCHDCPSITQGPQLRITSPLAGDSFVVTPGRSVAAQKLALEAAAPPSSRKLFWFLDGELVASSERAAAAYVAPSAGTHRLRCVDDSGHADWITFSVAGD
jgi:penicillin-binding protein 1C